MAIGEESVVMSIGFGFLSFYVRRHNPRVRCQREAMPGLVARFSSVPVGSHRKLCSSVQIIPETDG